MRTKDKDTACALRAGVRGRADGDAESDEDSREIRYSLTALGVALLSDSSRVKFRGFGPCATASRERAG